MELKIRPFPKNNYPKRGILIKSASSLDWFCEIESLGIDLNAVQSFAIPSFEPNILYGCFIIFGGNAPGDIGKNAYFQCFDNTLFIPENTDFYPKITSDDWKNIEAKYIIMHPDFGLVKLNETIDWSSLLRESVTTEARVKRPSNGVFIPQKIRSYKVDMNDDELLNELLNPTTDEEWMKNLPFDLEKLKAGDENEILKYIEYLKKYPERAVYLGIPLDIHSALRGGFGNFNWGGFDSLGGGSEASSKENGTTGKITGPQKMLIIILALIVMIIFAIDFGRNQARQEQEISSDSYSENAVEANPYTENAEGLVFESGFTEIDRKVDSIFGNERSWLIIDYKRNINNKEGKAEMLWKIEKYRAKEKKFRDSLKKIYQKKIDQVVELKTKNYHKKVLDSIMKDSSSKMSKGSKELYADDVLEIRKRLLSDSLARIYGTSQETDPQIVLNENAGKRAVEVKNQIPEKREITLSEIIWFLLFIIGAVFAYSYFIKKKPLYMGGDYVSDGIKIILIVILGAALLYIFYPLINSFGYNWLVWLLIIGVVILLYRLFSEDENILKSGKK